MASPTRILCVSDEVAPFTDASDIARIVRTLPEQLQESGEFEVRILMPRYGTISERRNRLHEVIRLSGTEITLGDRTETLKCKVASIPGIRLQVYFMDNKHYFKRKGIYKDKQGKLFEDNAERGLFFARATLETIRNLGWKPDVVHAFGWMSGFVPMYLRHVYASDPIYEGARIFYTPLDVDFEAPVTDELAAAEDLSKAALKGKDGAAIGREAADTVILPPGVAPQDNELVFEESEDEWLAQLSELYDQSLNEVAA